MSNWKDWLKRYLPANIFSTLITLIVTLSIYLTTHNGILAAFVGSIVESISYYLFILVRDMIETRKKLRMEQKKYTRIHAIKNVRNLFLEFTVAELFDTFLIRPFFLYWTPLVIGNYAWGILIGKYLADIVFYIPTIIAYELRKKHLKD